MFTEIWNNAYNLFSKSDDGIMWDYLREQVSNGNISQGDAEEIADDVITTYNL